MKCCVGKQCLGKLTIQCLKCRKDCCMKHIQCEFHGCDAPIKPLVLPEALKAPKMTYL